MNTVLIYGLVAQSQQSPRGGLSSMLFMIMALMFVFYLLILRPQKRQERERQQMLGSLEKGDKVTTIGGIYGTVIDIDENGGMVTLEVAKNVRLDFTRSAISQITKKKKQPKSETS